jgi:hypothetical protein
MKPALDQNTLSDFKAHANARKSLVANFSTNSQNTTNMNTFNENVTRKSIVMTTTSMVGEAIDDSRLNQLELENDHLRTQIAGLQSKKGTVDNLEGDISNLKA